MKLRVIGLEFWPLLVHKTIEPEAVAVAFGVREVRQDLRDGEAIGSRFPRRILLCEFAHQPAQNLRRGFQLPNGREPIIFHLSILRCSPRHKPLSDRRELLRSISAPAMTTTSIQ